MKYLQIIIIFLFVPNVVLAKTGLPLPRFASLKSSEVNVRTGPGIRYQIKWVMVRKGMPVEITAEFEQWRKIKDVQNDEGWVHKSLLSGKRHVIITGLPSEQPEHLLRRYSSYDSTAIARIERGVNAELLSCTEKFCKIRTEIYKGWIERKYLWGVYNYEMME